MTASARRHPHAYNFGRRWLKRCLSRTFSGASICSICSGRFTGSHSLCKASREQRTPWVAFASASKSVLFCNGFLKRELRLRWENKGRLWRRSNDASAPFEASCYSAANETLLLFYPERFSAPTTAAPDVRREVLFRPRSSFRTKVESVRSLNSRRRSVCFQ